MKKLSMALLCLAGLFAAGCDTDIATDEIQSVLSDSENLCLLSGGVYVRDDFAGYASNGTPNLDNRCHCGRAGTQCPRGVNCVAFLDSEGNLDSKCAGVGYTFLTEGACTMRGVEVCTDRIDANGNYVGYFTKCGDNNQWTEEARCDHSYSCEIYKFQNRAMSSRCGECQNDGQNCIAGKLVNETGSKNSNNNNMGE